MTLDKTVANILENSKKQKIEDEKELRFLSEQLTKTRELIETADFIVVGEEEDYHIFIERGKRVKVNSKFSFRVDRTFHLQGREQDHVHIYDRRNRNIITMNRDGSKSHNNGGVLDKSVAQALSKIGFTIPPYNVVEIVEFTSLDWSIELIVG